MSMMLPTARPGDLVAIELAPPPTVSDGPRRGPVVVAIYLGLDAAVGELAGLITIGTLPWIVIGSAGVESLWISWGTARVVAAVGDGV